MLLGVGVFGYHQQPRSALVQPVDGVEVAVLPGLLVVVHEKVAQGVGKVAVAGVHQQAGGLVDHHHVLILPNKVQRPRGGHGAGSGGRVGQAHRQHFPRLNTVSHRDPLAVHHDAVGEPFDAPQHRPGQVQVPPQYGVDLQAHQVPLNGNAQISGSHAIPPQYNVQYSSIIFLDRSVKNCWLKCQKMVKIRHDLGKTVQQLLHFLAVSTIFPSFVQV